MCFRACFLAADSSSICPNVVVVVVVVVGSQVQKSLITAC